MPCDPAGKSGVSSVTAEDSFTALESVIVQHSTFNIHHSAFSIQHSSESPTKDTIGLENNHPDDPMAPFVCKTSLSTQAH